MKLTKPSIEYKGSFIEAAKEFEAEGKNMYMFSQIMIGDLEKDFEKFLLGIENKEVGLNLPEGRVPQSEFWLVDGDKFLGWTKIRHRLNEKLLREGGHIGYAIRPSERHKGYGTKILELALVKAKELGIDKALLTCDDDNIGSAKIIEKNAGVLENKITAEDGSLKRRYWIENK